MFLVNNNDQFEQGSGILIILSILRVPKIYIVFKICSHIQKCPDFKICPHIKKCSDFKFCSQIQKKYCMFSFCSQIKKMEI